MALQLTERFVVHAPTDRVWEFLIDPRQVVTCLPGAELTSVDDERTFRGRVTVRVGPVTVRYAGRAQLVEVDDESRRVRLVGDAQEGGGGGSARLTMTSTLLPSGDGATEVSVMASVDLTGKLVQFGRGMIDDVSRQLFRQFAVCVESTLVATSDSASTPVAATHGASRGPTGGGRHTSEAPTPNAAAPEAAGGAKPVRLLPLLLGAIWRGFLRLLGRRPSS